MTPARTIGRFELGAEAASGALGTVYEARDPHTGARVAVKVLRGLFGSDEARFAREAQILSQIRHPGVVRYVDHGHTDEGHAYLVMEWLEGEDLRRRLARTGLSIGETVTLAHRVAEALESIHEHGLVHRDVKPANLFLCGGLASGAKIIDLGLVHTPWASVDVTATGMVVGTPSYMSPEQARGQRELDPRADVFALGCVLFKCLTGRAAFEGESMLAVLAKVLLEEVRPPSALRPEVPAALSDLVVRMLHKDVALRPQSAAAVAHELAALGPLGDLGESTEPAPPSVHHTGLTTDEQRASVVLLVGAGRLDGGSAPKPPAQGCLDGGSAPKPPAQGCLDGGSAPKPPAQGRLDGGSAPKPPAQGCLDGGSAPKPPAQGCLDGGSAPKPPAQGCLDGGSAPGGIELLVAEHGGRLDSLLDGTRVVTLVAPGVVTDQAARLARCALSLHAALPGAPIALAAGRSDGGRESARRPAGNAIERAAALLAARAEAARAGRFPVPIAVDALAAALLDPRFDVASGGDAGLSLLGMRAAPPDARTLLRRALPIVGREWELGSILHAFHECVEDGEASIMLVTGAAGMGKSRLAHEAVSALGSDFPAAEVWWGRGDPLRARSALGQLGQILRHATGGPEGGSPEARRRRFAESIAARVPPRDAAWVTELLGEIPGVLAADEPGAPLPAVRQDARAVRERLRAAWVALVSGVTAARPLLIVLDDLQWADVATVKLLDAALADLGHQPWMLLALARPEVDDTFVRLWEGRRLQEIRLAPLPRRAAERLVRLSLGDEADAGTVRRIAAQAEGNAFYLEELIRAVAGGAPGAEPVALPETVLAMAQARVAGLDAGTRRVLRAASVFGEVFWEGGVAALLGAAPDEGWVERLVESELVALRPEGRFAGERELVFRHALLREGAYAMLTEGDRALGHALAGAWLSQRGEDDAMVLAQHFEVALDEARAASFYQAAAAQALRAGDADAAIARARKALGGEPPGGAGLTGEARIQCLTLLCEAHAFRDDWALASGYADEVVRLAATGTEPWIRALSWKLNASMTLDRTGEVADTLAAFVTAEVMPPLAGELVPTLTRTVYFLSVAGKLPLAARVAARMEAIVAAEGARAPRHRAAVALAHVWVAGWGLGDPWAALLHARAARDGSRAAGDLHQARFAQIFLGVSLQALGLLEEAEAELTARAPASGDMLTSLAELCLGMVLLDRRALAALRDLAERRIARSRAGDRGKGALREAQGRWMLGEAAALSGDLETAEREIVASLGPLRVSAQLWQVAAARLVTVLIARGRVSEALGLAREVSAARVAGGGHGYRGTLTRLCHAEALAAAGDREAAREALREAWDDLDARAARIGDAEVRRRFLEVVPENARVVALGRAWRLRADATEDR